MNMIVKVISFLKDTLIYCNSSDYFSDSVIKQMFENICNFISEDKIYKSIDILLDSIKSAKTTNNVKLIFELAVIRIIELDKEKLEETVTQNEISILD